MLRFPLLVACATLAISAAAQDDRLQTSYVPTVLRTGQTATDLDIMRQTGLRVTDLEVESTAPLRFSVSAVSNSASYDYRKTWYYYVDVTTSQLSANLASSGSRLIDLETWDDNGTVKHAAIAIRNAGADQIAWWWYAGLTSLQVNSFVNSNSARLINLERYSQGGSTRYSCIMVSNTGANQRPHRHFYSATLATIDAWNAANNMRVYDIERVSQDRFDAICVGSQGEVWWHYYGLSRTRVATLMAQKLGRVIDVERRPLFGGLVQYDVVMMDNARTDLERRTRERLDVTDGVTGAYLKRVGGGLIAFFNENFVFEPAETMMTLHLAHGVRELDERRVTPRDPFEWFSGKNGSCPTGSGRPRVSNVPGALRAMMVEPDTSVAMTVEQRFNTVSLAQTAVALGMTRTSINHRVGCGGPTPNETTLVDLATLHEQAATSFFRTSIRGYFFGAMESSRTFPTWGTTSLEQRIETYGTALGLSQSSLTRFREEIRLDYMSGSYTVGGRHYHSEAGSFDVAFLDPNGNLLPVEYVFGTFDHGGSDQANSRSAVSEAAHELVWDKVREALDSWASIYTLTVRSMNPTSDVFVTVLPADENGWADGRTEFKRDYFRGRTVTLEAPASYRCNPFRRWVLDGVPQFVGLRQVSFSMNGSRTAVAEYRQRVVGTVQQLGPGCPGRSGKFPVQTIIHGNGQCGPQQGTATTYALEDALASTVGVLHIGFGTSLFGNIPLPWDMSSIGATGCSLYHDLIVSPQFQTNLEGKASVELTWPVDPAARGLDFHTTFAIVDFVANPLGLVHSNALSVAQGGVL